MNLHRAFSASLVIATLFLASFVVQAKYTLSQSDSQINFISVKNDRVGEIHSFDKFSGTLSNEGKLNVEVTLSSVNTAIDIRNQRMQNLLFNTDVFPNATFSAQIEPSLLELSAGESTTTTVAGQLSLHGQSVPMEFTLRVNALAPGKIQVNTLVPSLLNVDDFDLGKGLEALREIAKLQNIAYSVPLTFNVVFEA